MTENSELPEQQPQEPEQALPGRHLFEAREARGLTREGVASQLRLNVRLITALEEDDYDALPGPTYTSGYLRSYARLLELPEDSFVASAQAKHQPPPLVSTSASIREISSSDGIARLATFLIVGVIIVSVAMWWLGRQEEIEPEADLPVAEMDEVQVDTAATELNESLAGSTETPEPVEESGKEMSSQSGDSPDTETGTSVAETESEQQLATADVSPEPVAESKPTPPPPAAARVTPARQEPPPLTDATPQTKLELRFEADSWTEVKDNAGRQLLYRLVKAGEAHVLRGEAPFHVFLGYAPGVTVYYNGELFEHSAFQRRDVARFRVGRSEHNHPVSR